MNASTSQTELPVPLTELLEEYFRHQAQFSSSSFMVNRLAGDGSDRIYYRVQPADGSKSLIAVKAVHGRDKSCQSPQGLTITENHSFMYLSQHLTWLGFPVPGVLLSSLDCSYYLLEDLGHHTLYDLVNHNGWNREVFSYYQQALELLILIQQKAGKTFNPDWCYDGGYYDQKLIISRELEYFLYSFALPLGKVSLSNGERQHLSREFNHLAELALSTPSRTFLYRDYQSKNLMIKDGQLHLIDFQGARLGPLYYDLVSLVNDPYTNLPRHLRQNLFDNYYTWGLVPLSLPSQKEFDRFIALFSLIRCLQVLGAFGFLSSQKQRLHFRAYIPRTLADLKNFADSPLITSSIPILRQLIQQLSFPD